MLQGFENRSELLVRPCVEEWGPNSPKKTYVRIGSNNYGFCRWEKVCPLSHRKTVGRPCALRHVTSGAVLAAVGVSIAAGLSAIELFAIAS